MSKILTTTAIVLIGLTAATKTQADLKEIKNTTTYTCPAVDKVKIKAEVKISTEETGWSDHVIPSVKDIAVKSSPIAIMLVPPQNMIGVKCEYPLTKGAETAYPPSLWGHHKLPDGFNVDNCKSEGLQQKIVITCTNAEDKKLLKAFIEDNIATIETTNQ